MKDVQLWIGRRDEAMQQAAARYRVALAVRLERAGYPGQAARSLREAGEVVGEAVAGHLLATAEQMTDSGLLTW